MNEEMKIKQRVYRSRTGNSATKKYERTERGKLMRIYRNMESRITGVQWQKKHLYEGKELLPREDFYDWAIDNPQYVELFKEWVASDYDRKLAPSVDRLDSTKGYIIGNMEWVTHSENSRRGSVSGHNKRKEAV